MVRAHILICGGTGCTSSRSMVIAEKLNEELKARELENLFQSYSSLSMDDPLSYCYHLNIFSSLHETIPYMDYLEKVNRLGSCKKAYFCQRLIEKDNPKKRGLRDYAELLHAKTLAPSYKLEGIELETFLYCMKTVWLKNKDYSSSFHTLLGAYWSARATQKLKSENLK